MDKKKLIVVTGASAGIGYATANLLGTTGFKTIGTSRNIQETKGETFRFMQLDVTSDSSVHGFVSSVQSEVGQIDVLINNAGIGSLGALEETNLGEAKMIFETNFFGTVRMINAVLPEMRKRKRGLIINLGSMAAAVPIPYHGYLTASKAAINSYTDALRLEVFNLGIRVVLLQLGMVRTHLGEKWNDLKTSKTIPDYHPVEDAVLKRLETRSSGSIPPESVAKKILEIINTLNPRPHYLIGKERNLVRFSRLLPTATLDYIMKKELKMHQD
jgi:short-subunit dehydrogenase